MGTNRSMRVGLISERVQDRVQCMVTVGAIDDGWLMGLVRQRLIEWLAVREKLTFKEFEVFCRTNGISARVISGGFGVQVKDQGTFNLKQEGGWDDPDFQLDLKALILGGNGDGSFSVDTLCDVLAKWSSSVGENAGRWSSREIGDASGRRWNWRMWEDV